MSSTSAIARIGGHPALDFANTAGWHASEQRLEHLTSFGEWLAWVRETGLESRSLAQVARLGARHPADAARALRRVIARRELIFRVFAAVAQGRSPLPADLDALHRAQVAALDAAGARWHGGRLSLVWKADRAALDTPLHPLTLAAGDLLASPGIERLRQCANHPCGWLFLDQSKNGSRRWCSSAECGNASRVRRFRSLQRRSR
jgi:predicted RNA-binding Zn ribbon-like protein